MKLKQLDKRNAVLKRGLFRTSRHTFATRGLRKGIRMEHASKVMGHENLKTSQIYFKIVNEDLDRAMEVLN